MNARTELGPKGEPVGHDVAPVIAAEALFRHGMSDEVVAAYLSRTWPLDDIDCRAAVRAARILLHKEQHVAAGEASPPGWVL